MTHLTLADTPPLAASQAQPAAVELPFDDIYDRYFGYVWRNIRRMGVPEWLVDDAVQEVFIVVHRRRHEFEGRASVKTWIFRILVRVAADHRRTLRRKSPHLQPGAGAVDPTTLPAPAAGPHERAALREAGELLHRVLDHLSDDKRAIFVLAELEELPVPQIAETLGINLNTAYARLRAARQDFEKAVKRAQARDGWRVR